MKLRINGFTNELDFYNDKVSILVVKDTKCFTNIIQKINDKINGIESEEISGETKLQNLFIEVRKNIVEEINEFPFEFTMSDDIDIINILKLYNLKVDILSYETILEKIEFFIDLNATLNIFNVIVVPNLKMYLSEKELIELYKYSLYNNVKLLLIEKNFTQKLEYEHILAIDEEFDDYIV